MAQNSVNVQKNISIGKRTRSQSQSQLNDLKTKSKNLFDKTAPSQKEENVEKKTRLQNINSDVNVGKKMPQNSVNTSKNEKISKRTRSQSQVDKTCLPMTNMKHSRTLISSQDDKLLGNGIESKENIPPKNDPKKVAQNPVKEPKNGSIGKRTRSQSQKDSDGLPMTDMKHSRTLTSSQDDKLLGNEAKSKVSRAPTNGPMKVKQNSVNPPKRTRSQSQKDSDGLPMTSIELSKTVIPTEIKSKENIPTTNGPMQTKKSVGKAVCLNATKVPLATGDLCFAKVKGYAEWPAIVIGVEGNIFEVEFFNSGQTAKCGMNKVYDLFQGLHFLTANKTAAFKKAVKEMAVIFMDTADNDKLKGALQQYQTAYA